MNWTFVVVIHAYNELVLNYSSLLAKNLYELFTIYTH